MGHFLCVLLSWLWKLYYKLKVNFSSEIHLCLLVFVFIYLFFIIIPLKAKNEIFNSFAIKVIYLCVWLIIIINIFFLRSTENIEIQQPTELLSAWRRKRPL